MAIFSYNNNIFSYNNKVFTTPWKPNRISGLIFWSDANTRNILQNENLIHQWKDNSGNLNHAIQINDSYKPSLVDSVINGYPAIMFQNTRFLNISLTLNYYTVFTVINSLNNKYIYEFGNNCNTGTGFYLTGDVSAVRTAKLSVSYSATAKDYNDNWLSGSWKILSHQYDGTNKGHKLYINKSNALLNPLISNNPGALGVTDNLHLGARYDSSNGTNAYIPEFLVFNRCLSLTEINQINDWLNDKYAIY